MPTTLTIPFNKPTFLGPELQAVNDCIVGNALSGDHHFTKQCSSLLQERFGSIKVLLTTSCTAALEMCALLLDIQPGDEVICPSFTFVTSASAFALRGATIVFVDIRPDTLNIDEQQIEDAITDKTKAILVVHYAGIAAEMDTILAIAERHGLAVVEDAAQAIGSTYKGNPCGRLAELGCYSFHETKNIVCGEGGALLINNAKYVEHAEIIREKGTNRTKFHKGQVDKYTWVELGSSYLPSDIVAAYLYPQLLQLNHINDTRRVIWDKYHQHFERYERTGAIRRPTVPAECGGNGHMYYLLFTDPAIRTRYIEHMKKRRVLTVFHYIPLHSAPAGKLFGTHRTDMAVTNHVSACLARLPLFYALTPEEADYVIESTCSFLETC